MIMITLRRDVDVDDVCTYNKLYVCWVWSYCSLLRCCCPFRKDLLFKLIRFPELFSVAAS